MRVSIYAPLLFHAAELAAVCDALMLANAFARVGPAYDVHIVAEHAGPLRGRCGLTILPDTVIGDGAEAELLIVAASDAWATPPSAATIDWLRRSAGAAKRFGGIGNGVFLLGAAGLLDGRRLTTHWSCSDELGGMYRSATVEPSRIFVRDGPLFSCAGGVATFDLILDLVEEDHGRELALELARQYVMFMKRAGGQDQVSMQLSTQAATQDPVQRVQAYVHDHPTADLSVTALAAVAVMSTRNLARIFHQETGYRPSDFVEQFRVKLARRLLEESGLSPQQVARHCGFSSTETARRAFGKHVGMTMARYRGEHRDVRPAT